MIPLTKESQQVEMQDNNNNNDNKNQQASIVLSSSILFQQQQADGIVNRKEEFNLIRNEENVIQVNYDELIKSLRSSGQAQRSDHEQPSLIDKPEWFNEELYKNAKSVYERHFMGTNFAHLSGLLLLVRVDSIYSTLNGTGESATVSKLFKRYYHTVKHVKTWYEGDIFQINSDAYRSLLIVRGMHNKVSKKLNDNQSINTSELELKQLSYSEDDKLIDKNGNNNNIKFEKSKESYKRVHISEYDIMITQFAFIGFIVTNGNKMGFLDDFDENDMKSLIHFWRIIGYLLGASDKYNLCSYEFNVIKELCQAIMRIEYKESLIKNHLTKEQGIMGVNIVRSLKFIPMLTVYGIMRYLYEIVDHETTELQDRRGWYSNLSYTFIKLVMTNLLRYKPLRLFNNGLTRLSLYLVGKTEMWFSNYLESKYGDELKI